MSTKSSKIESILPLSYLQRALLFHSLAEEKDQGIIQVSCRLEGRLNPNAFEGAWQSVLARHSALRSSVHWEKVKEPVQVVRPKGSLSLVHQNLLNMPEQEQQKTINDYKQKDANTKFELTKAPVNRLILFQTNVDTHELLWTSHHLLLDGWSAGIILRDVFTYYEAEVTHKAAKLTALPSLQHYANWLKKQDRVAAAEWWKERLSRFSAPTLLGTGVPSIDQTGEVLKTEEQNIPKEVFTSIEASIREHRLTLNTVAQGLWGLLISRLCSSKDVLFGTTVSGRTPDIPRHHEMAGLFTNAIPVRVQPEEGQLLSKWLLKLQADNLTGASHDFAHMGEIIEWSGIEPNILRFDHLLLVQNYPWSDLAGGEVTVTNFSGDLTSTQPLVVMLRPQEGLTLTFRYNSLQLPEDCIQWLLSEFSQLFNKLPTLLGLTTTDIQDQLSQPPYFLGQKANTRERDIEGFATANSSTELTLVGIWEKLLSLSPIGVTDDFFSSGGTSMLAIRLFARIETAFGKNLPPITILQHRTIRRLATIIDDDTVTTWTNIVPLKANGTKPALFCFHAGMGHVFFYHSLAKLVDKDRPVYAIQPTGLDGKDKSPTSIQEMTAHYLREIKRVQPNGPYLFLSYCFSTAVCVELCHLLRAEGQPPPIMIVVDSAPLPRELDEAIQFRKKRKRLRWFVGRLYKGQFRRLQNAIQLDYMPTLFLPQELREERKVNKVRDQYIPLYEQYLWKDIDSDVFLIRSSEFATMPVKEWHLKTWTRLSGNRLETVTVEANHNDFFDAPAVNRLATTIEAYLKERT